MTLKQFLPYGVELTGLTIGCFLFALGTNAFLTPAELLAGGLGGVCVIFYHLFHWSLGIQYFIYNIPLVILGYRFIGSKFIFYTFYAVIVSSFFLNTVPVEAIWTDDPLLCAIFGAIISSAGAGLLLRVGGSVGGLDILSRIIAKYFNMTVGTFGFIVSAVIIMVSAILFDAESALYTIISFLIGAKTYDLVLSMAEKRTLLIVTEAEKNLPGIIESSMGKQPTLWQLSNTHSAQKVMLFYVILKGEFSPITKLVKETDDSALVVTLPTDKVFGTNKIKW